MTAAVLLVVGLAIVAGLAALMIRLERVQRRLIERRHEAWKAEGGAGAHPDDFIGHGGGFSSFGG